MGSPVLLDGASLTLETIEDVAVRGVHVALTPASRAWVTTARESVDAILRRGESVYGVNTGFGALAHVRIDDTQLAQLQLNLVRSHSVGVGIPFDIPTTRAIMLLRANVLAAGHSGTRLEVLDRLLALLNLGIHPVIPSQGSVGASGDLAPLAHLALVLIGEGRVHDADGAATPSGPVLESHGLAPLHLQAKEGLALINGTQAMTGLGALVVCRARRLARTADVITALTVEAKLGSRRPFDPRLHRLRPHPGQGASASNLARLTEGGEIGDSHAGCEKVQDAYSLRCAPQVHGAARDTIEHVASVLLREANSVTDNPTLFPETGEVISGGNFHGQPVAMALDFLAMAAAELASISERRIEQLVNSKLSQLPAFLVSESGVNSGFMMAQVTAAALVSENKGLCHPASIDTIPTSANQEDHVSMGPIAARKAMAVLVNSEQVLGIEALVAAQAVEFHEPLLPAPGAKAALDAVRLAVSRMDEDRELHGDLLAAAGIVRSGALVDAAEAVVGTLD
ncbi:MAG: histidine ammonia-lyase [Deltaproteobacteria bacterium]|nr:histidine ammonia-lyase [Deltaproteobacteria bacterium]